MPPKIRELISDLERAGFRNRGGRGSHRNYIHLNTNQKVTLSGNPGSDAAAYQTRDVRNAIERSQQ